MEDENGNTDSFFDLARFNGTNWQQLSNARGRQNRSHSGFLRSIALHGNVLFAAGQFRRMGGLNSSTISTNHVAYWNGGTWNALGEGVRKQTSGSTQDPTVEALTVDRNGIVYIAGDFNRATNADGWR